MVAKGLSRKKKHIHKNADWRDTPMKKLSKIVALLLAGAMAMVMLTACTGGGNTGSNLKEDKDAEAKVLSKYSTSVANNKELKDEAEKFLDEKLTVSGGIGGYRFVLDGKVKGKDKEYLTVLVAANFSYNDTLLGVILDEISKKVKTDADVNINQNGTWTDIGVVVKSDPKTKQSYMAIAFKVKNPNKK
jgi:hypothetical protein